jgi:23S rRNA A2030 N6-methylase RlmJ
MKTGVQENWNRKYFLRRVKIVAKEKKALVLKDLSFETWNDIWMLFAAVRRTLQNFSAKSLVFTPTTAGSLLDYSVSQTTVSTGKEKKKKKKFSILRAFPTNSRSFPWN